MGVSVVESLYYVWILPGGGDPSEAWFLRLAETTEPDSTITSGPADPTASTTATFAFTSSEAGGTFERSLDGGDWLFLSTDTSETISNVRDGNHTYRVRATDVVGNVESTPAAHAWLVDTLNPSGTVLIENGAAYATTTSVSLTLSAQDAGSGVSSMRFSNDAISWSVWESYATSKSWTLAAGEGLKAVHAQYQDRVSNPSDLAFDTITLDTQAPTGSVVINGGAAHTNTLGVTLTLSASDETSGVRDMRFSNDGVDWSPWEAYATSKAWTLSTGDGT
jgi:hypothetical protein